MMARPGEHDSRPPLSAKSMPAEFRVSIKRTHRERRLPDLELYLGCSFRKRARTRRRARILADFLTWMVNERQKMVADLSYAPLPTTVGK